jgi:phospholipid transport system substrate-binding protein
MPETSIVQKFDVIVGHPLTEACRRWLMALQTRGPAGAIAAAAASSFALRREPARMTSIASPRASRHSTSVGVAFLLAFFSLTLPIAAAQAQQLPAPPNDTSSIDANAPVTAGPPAPTAKAADQPAAPAPVVRRESPAGFMKRVGNELLAASRSGSAAQFAMVLNSNADVPSIGLSALGDYARSLPKNDRPIYYNGMINFIARYASKEAPKYPVARFIVTAQSKEDSRGTYVDSRITLTSGDGYDVRWLIVKRGDIYKVRDAQVVGFWMTSFLDNLFQSFISDNGGNPKALVVALNR